MNVAYVRVSTAEQNEERQIKAISDRCSSVEKWFTEKVSGKSMDRPKLKEMLDYVREGDTVYVHDLSRLARSTADLLKIVEILEDKKVTLVSNKESIDTSTPTGRLLLTFIGAINEFERDNLLERQREGIAIAKANGKYKGRKKIKRSQFPNWKELYERFSTDRKFSKSAFARELKISRNTLQVLLDEEAAEQQKPKRKRKTAGISAEIPVDEAIEGQTAFEFSEN